MGEPERRRRRLRPPSSAAASAEAHPAETPAVEAERAPMTGPVAETSAVEDPAKEDDERTPQPPGRLFAGRTPRSPGSRPTSGAGAGGDDREAERGLRGLVGSGSSQVSVGAALRARDAARPTEAQLADAEQNLSIVRRNWSPREDLPRSR
jgi:hypothetical protein